VWFEHGVTRWVDVEDRRVVGVGHEMLAFGKSLRDRCSAGIEPGARATAAWRTSWPTSSS
jgi:hypothetical protein